MSYFSCAQQKENLMIYDVRNCHKNQIPKSTPLIFYVDVCEMVLCSCWLGFYGNIYAIFDTIFTLKT